METPKNTVLLLLITFQVMTSSCLAKQKNTSIFELTQEEIKKLRLVYYSDYFSFVGRDDQGWVGFALDNNRGQDGDRFQAEHFVVLHDENKGWVELKGNGDYVNSKNQLEVIPDSQLFKFNGNISNGFKITSEANDLKLATQPLIEGLKRSAGKSDFWIGSADATLHWGDRMIKGRLIYEFLYVPGFNRLSRSYPDLWNNFHGIYLVIDGADGDFYFHDKEGGTLKQLTGKRVGFMRYKDHSQAFSHLEVEVTESTAAAGVYRWPTRWTGKFRWRNQTYSFDFSLQHRNTISNWVTGGFSMGIITGTLTKGDKTFKVYGLGELLI